ATRSGEGSRTSSRRARPYRAWTASTTTVTRSPGRAPGTKRTKPWCRPTPSPEWLRSTTSSSIWSPGAGLGPAVPTEACRATHIPPPADLGGHHTLRPGGVQGQGLREAALPAPGPAEAELAAAEDCQPGPGGRLELRSEERRAGEAGSAPWR